MFVRSSEFAGAISFQNHKILLPCVSVGNIGQLTVDLIINTLRLSRVGYLEHSAILPLVGNDAFDHTQPAGFLHTAAEVYLSVELKLLIVQLRTPLAKSLKGDFCLKLLEWVKEEGMSEAIVLTSSHAHERRDSQIRGEPFRYLLSSSASDLNPLFNDKLQWTSLEPRYSEFDNWNVSSSPHTSTEDQPQGILQDSHVFLPGAGLAKKLYKQSNLLGIRLIVLIAFCTQGDNIQDAIVMAGHIDKWIGISKKQVEGMSTLQWLCPSSWSNMYGGPSPSTLF